jgi:hypothetical protein
MNLFFITPAAGGVAIMAAPISATGRTAVS